MNVIAQITGLILCTLAVLKFLEMGKCILWALKDGEAFMNALPKKFASLNPSDFQDLLTVHKHPSFPGNTFLTKPLKKLFTQHVWKRLIGVLFRYPSLMFLCAFVSFMTEDILARKMIFVVLCFGLGIETFHLVIYRYRFGPVDNLLNIYSTRFIEHGILLPVPRHVAVRRFMLIYLVTFLLIVFVYGSIYDSIADGVFSGNSLLNMSCDEPRWFQSLYFSTLTICTVGYGDILPKGLLVRSVAASQMVLGFTLLVLLLTAISATLDSDSV